MHDCNENLFPIYLFTYYQRVHIVQENKRKKVTQLLDSLQYS